MKDQNIINYSPSEFAFGFEACNSCYYDKKINGIELKVPFPGIFSKFVAETPGDFTSGKLYAYREDDQRMRLSHQLSNTDMFSEISAFDPSTNMLFSTYTDGAGVLVHTFTNAESLDSLAFIDLASHGEPTSVAAKNGLLAIAIANDVSTADGKVLILDSDLNILNDVTTGVLPDMVAFSPDGNYIVSLSMVC